MDETTKAMIKDMIKRGMDNDAIMGVTGATQEQIDQVATEGKSSFLDKLGIFSTAQASEINPNNPPSMLPTGAMDRETPFGDRLQPTIPRGGDIFSGREFGNIRGGITDGSVGQRYNIDNPELSFNKPGADTRASDDDNFFDYLANLSGGVVDFAKDLGGRYIASQTLGGAGAMINPYLGVAAGIAGLMGGGNLFGGGKGMAPDLQKGLYSQYGEGPGGGLATGIMQGYNPRGGNLLLRAVDRRQNVLRNLKNPKLRAAGYKGLNYDPLTDFINQQVKAQTEYYGGTGVTDVTGSSDYTSTGSPQSMGSARGGAGGRPY